MGTSNNGNGNGHKPSLEMLGAPLWYCVSYRELETRVSSLEKAVLTDSSRKGRKWGALAGTFCAVFISTAVSQCSSFVDLLPKSHIELHP